MIDSWNTKPDGSGTAYSLDTRFHYGYERQLPNGNWEFVIDEAAVALIPDKLYAQWEKLPSAELPIPLDMRQQNHAVIYAAIYDADGSFAGIQEVAADQATCALYDTKRGMTYQFFCMADDGTAQPLTTLHRGTF